MKKRMLSLVLVLAMGASVLAGCGSGTGTTTAAPTTQATTAATTAANGETQATEPAATVEPVAKKDGVTYSIADEYEPWVWEVAVNNENFRQAIFSGISRVSTMYVETGDNVDPYTYIQNTITPAGFAVDSATGKDFTEFGAFAEINSADFFDQAAALAARDAAVAELTAQGVTFPVKVLVRYNPANSGMGSDKECTILEQQLEAVLNDGFDFVDIIVEAGPSEGYLSAVRRSCDYMLLLCNWGADYADPQTYVDPFYQAQNDDGSYNRGMRYAYMAYSVTDEMASAEVIKGYFELVEAATAITSDTTARYEAFATAEAYLIEHALVVPYGTSVSGYVATKLNPWEGQYAAFGVSSNRYKGQHLLDSFLTMEQYTDGANGNLTAPYTDTDNDVFRVLYSAELTTLNYLTSSNTSEQTIGANVVDTLVEYDNNGEIKASLATDWSYDAETMTWTFTIREGQKWINNKGEVVADVTANDFVSAMEYMLNPENGSSTISGVFGIIANAEEYYNFKAGESTEEVTFEQVGVKAVDDYTLQYTLCDEVPYFLSMMTYVTFMPVYGPYANDLGTAYATSADTMLYCGAYYVSTYEPQVQLVYSKNVNNWDAEHVYIETIQRTYNAEASSIGPEMAKRGEIDYVSLDSNLAKDWLSDSSLSAMVSMERPSIDYSYFYCFNFNVIKLDESYYR